ncbi:retention module-containing protein [Photobacterium leiognathi]|uniref:retention module-containing protein n=1 Tax=Photobacterium leiognathi TaxID=553611 RepID=UPI003AF3BD8D
MKIIKTEHALAINNIVGDVFIQGPSGVLETLRIGMEIQPDQTFYLAQNASVGFSDKTRDDYILRNFDTRDLNNSLHMDLAFHIDHPDKKKVSNESQEVIDIINKILSGNDPTKTQQPTAAGAAANSSSISEPVTIEYDNDQILTEAGFSTAFQRQLVIQDDDFIGEDQQRGSTQIPLSVGITIDSISQDDVVTALESKSPQLIVGSVSGDAKVGDIVSIFIDGKQVGNTQVIEQDGKLIWTLEVDGKTLLQANKDTVSATITIQDGVGNTATASTTHDYQIDIQASITINPVTDDNIITQVEGNEAILPISGFVGKDVQPGDRVTVIIDGNEYTTTVKDDLTWTVNVTGEDILKADQVTATVTTNYGTPKEATASDSENYKVVIDASITIDSIAGDGIVNQDESVGKVPIIGTVGKDVKPGDVVTISIGDKTYTTIVNADNTWRVEVDGSALVENGSDSVTASVTTSDIAGNSATATADKPYEVDKTIEAVITINDVTADNTINEIEATETIPLSGTVGGDVKVGDVVTVIIDGNQYTTPVIEKDGQLVWEVSVPGSVLANANVETITATVTATDSAGNEKEATSIHDYDVKTLDVSVTVESINDGVPITGSQYDNNELVNVSGLVGGEMQKKVIPSPYTLVIVKYKPTLLDCLMVSLVISRKYLEGYLFLIVMMVLLVMFRQLFQLVMHLEILLVAMLTKPMIQKVM